MPRVKRGVGHTKHRKNILKAAKGFRWGRKNKIKLAKPAIMKAGAHALAARRKKKGDFRALWQVQINAGARLNGMNFSKLIGGLKKANIELDRKSLSDLARNHPDVFTKVVEKAK